MIRPIVQLGDPVLRQTAKRVHKVDASIERLIDDLLETMLDAPGSGLAAPQIGVPIRVIVTHLEDQTRVVVNPEIVWRSEDTEVADEGCLSIRGYAGPVERSVRCEVRGLNEKGKRVKIKAEEWMARILQHEVDHLNGVLYIDLVEDKSLIRRVDEDYEVEREDAMESGVGESEAADKAQAAV